MHPNQILGGKKHLLENVATLFVRKKDPKLGELEDLVEALYMKIGKQNVELEFLKKKYEQMMLK